MKFDYTKISHTKLEEYFKCKALPVWFRIQLYFDRNLEGWNRTEFKVKKWIDVANTIGIEPEMLSRGLSELNVMGNYSIDMKKRTIKKLTTESSFNLSKLDKIKNNRKKQRKQQLKIKLTTESSSENEEKLTTESSKSCLTSQEKLDHRVKKSENPILIDIDLRKDINKRKIRKGNLHKISDISYQEICKVVVSTPYNPIPEKYYKGLIKQYEESENSFVSDTIKLLVMKWCYNKQLVKNPLANIEYALEHKFIEEPKNQKIIEEIRRIDNTIPSSKEKEDKPEKIEETTLKTEEIPDFYKNEPEFKEFVKKQLADNPFKSPIEIRKEYVLNNSL